MAMKHAAFDAAFAAAALRTLCDAADAKGRVLSEMFLTLPDAAEFPDYYEQIAHPMDLDTIQDKVEQGTYESMQDFVHDVNLVFWNAQEYNLPESQIYADAVRLLRKFNEELSKDARFAELSTDGVDDPKAPDAGKLNLRLRTGYSLADSVRVGSVEYQVGGYVYIPVDGAGSKKNILQIHHIFQHPRHPTLIHGCRYYYPEQTYHLSSRKFFVNEVFKTVEFEEHPATSISGKCAVLFYRDFEKGSPVGFNAKDVYVCESRYSESSRSFQPIKLWRTCIPQSILNAVEATGLRVPFKLYSTPKKLSKTEASIFATSQKRVLESPSASATVTKSSGKLIIDKHGNVTAEKPKMLLKISGAAERGNEANETPEHPSKKSKLAAASSGTASSDPSTPTASSDPSTPTASGGSEPREAVRTKGDSWTIPEWLALFKLIEKHGIGKWHPIAEELAEILPNKRNMTPTFLRERAKRITKGFSIPCPLPQEIYKAMDLKIEDRKMISWIYEVRVKMGPEWYLQNVISTSKQLPLPVDATLAKMTPESQHQRAQASLQKAMEEIRAEEEAIPAEYKKELRTLDDCILWFATPPTTVVELPKPPRHSQTYLEYLHSKERAERVQEEDERERRIRHARETALPQRLLHSLEALADSLTPQPTEASE